MADEERKPELEEEEDPNAGELTLDPIQVETSDEHSSVGEATTSSSNGDDRVGTFIEMQPKFRELQRQIRAYANAHPQTTATQTSGTVQRTSSSSSSSSYSLPKTPSRPVTPPKPKTTTPTFPRGIRTGGQVACDVICYVTTLVLFLVTLFAYGYNPWTDEVMVLPQFIFEDSESFASPLFMMFKTLDNFDYFPAAMQAIRAGFIGINALVLLVQIHVFIIKCFAALCRKNCIQVRSAAMGLFRVLIYHYFVLATVGGITIDGFGYAMSPVLKVMLVLAGIVYFIISLCNAPNRGDSVQTERFVWKNRLVGVISCFLLLQILVQSGALGFMYNRVMFDWNQVMEVENADYLIAAFLDTFYFVVLCIFAKRVEKTIAISLNAMMIRRHMHIDYTKYSIDNNDKYLSAVSMIVLSAIAFGISVMIYPIFAEMLIGTEVLAEKVIFPFFMMLLLAIGTQIAKSVGKRR